ncbi:alpha/beta hydrolase [Roseibium aggregatum]|uniref:Alpha/beta hydrolase n=1 Tax=Roseibium aggregatum TaxID=187304 RepID=A0A939ECP2_9HYPH|nr:alpha/beta hydrolase [Roseibium aggregatum]MBN9670745.1 alpha/beta hydrolase [Roseibium aggregatum]
MTEPQIDDWDDAYANAAHIEGAAEYPVRWAKEAEAFRSGWAGKELDICYGKGDRQRFDLFFPRGNSKGLVVFVHGGYWLRFDKSTWSHLARGCLENGWTVCLPGYDLAPDVRIAEITQEITEAIETAAARVAGPIRLTGHSAGGHLVTRMLCEDAALPAAVISRIEKVVSISGLHDLRPLLRTEMNRKFKMTEEDAVAESPALKTPVGNCPVVAWVGSSELPEFLRQSEMLAAAWPLTVCRHDPGLHHFNVIDGLKEPGSPLTSALLGP